MTNCVQPLPNEALPAWAQAQLAMLHSQLTARDAELKQRDLRIQQLTLELAHHKRLRFGVKSEALAPVQRDLFLDTGEEDGAAMAAELAEQAPAPRVRTHKRTGRKP
jgi:transposase